MKKTAVLLVALLIILPLIVPAALATDLIPSEPETDQRSTLSDYFPFNLLGPDMTVDDATTTVEILVLLTILSLAPSILIMVTAFTRIVIVLSFTRSAMGTQSMPPNQVMVGLALFLTVFVMYPVYEEIKTDAWDPYAAEEIQLDEMLERTMFPIRKFMYEQIRLKNHEEDLINFMNIARLDPYPESFEEIPTRVLIPAFITSEIKTGFIIGFLIYIPFIVIDMVVASALMSMGMMMLPPVMISLPFKIMLFVLVDGWNLTVGTLVETFRGPG
ncbi:MAG: flagellar type III secretion system pore protein FliP [Oscillospiraceae bacterium]|nr:flagellar type III secretion system pore protein FliP [Oscillospiraceae bacterium]